MPRLIKPARLRHGDVIGVCSPASPPERPDRLARGIRYLESLGYRVEVARNTSRRHGYLAGSDELRVADLHDLFHNRHVRAIIATRGGFGCQRLLPHLDYRMIRRNPKPVIGYSDLTALQLALLACAGIPSVSGPMLTELPAAFGHSGELEEMFWRNLTSAAPLDPVPCTVRNGPATGRLFGGNLSLVAALTGTPYMPDPAGAVLLLEEIDERPYRIDRMLQQMNHAGFLGRLRGFALGEFTDCAQTKGRPSLSLQAVLDAALEGRPVARGLRYGHIRRPLTLPIGPTVRLGARRLVFLESPVR